MATLVHCNNVGDEEEDGAAVGITDGIMLGDEDQDGAVVEMD